MITIKERIHTQNRMLEEGPGANDPGRTRKQFQPLG